MPSVKVRFDGLDVTAMVGHLSKAWTGRRVVNIYDENDSTYIFKFEKEAATSAKEVVSDKPTAPISNFLLLESGVRFHPIAHYESTSRSIPSPICAKLRKHIRGLRLEQVLQVNYDRVVLFVFGTGQARHVLVLELYAKGNLILTDSQYTILSLLRSHTYQNPSKKTNQSTGESSETITKSTQEDSVQVQVGRVYPVAYATSRDSKDDEVGTGILAPDEASNGESSSSDLDKGQVKNISWKEWIQNTISKKAALSNKKQRMVNLKTLLLASDSGVSFYGPGLLEHCIRVANLEPHETIQSLEQIPDSDWERLRETLRTEARAIMESLRHNDDKGYILYESTSTAQQADAKSEENNENGSPKDDQDTRSAASESQMFQEFVPYLFIQHHNHPVIECGDFGAAVSKFFDKIYGQRELKKAQAAEETVRVRLEKIRKDQEGRLRALEEEQVVLRRQAHATQENATAVDQARTVINSALDSGMDWDQLEQLIQVEQENGNPIAKLITKLQLEDDVMTLRLPCDSYGDEGDTSTLVSISLKESAHANANALFAKYRAFKEKAEKTVEASSKALQAAEENAKRQLETARKQNPTMISTQRKPAWYEKFHWFITSDNYLVLGGKDAHQNEQLVKRYLRQGDAYLHADVHGAASCILRAKRFRRGQSSTRGKLVPLSEQALREAGNFTICRSSAWSSRMVTSAWWVESHQVSKTAPTGEYLSVGSFMVRGKKNFLPPSQLEMGLAVMFALGDEASIARHINDRRDFALMAIDSAGSDDDDEGSAHGGMADEADSASQNQGGTHPKRHATLDKDAPVAAAAVTADEASDSEEDQEDTETLSPELNPKNESPKSKRKGLSVRDRRLIRKYGSLEEAEKAMARKCNSDTVNESVADTKKPPVSGANTELKRGKKAKMKRAMKKYGDQDEEDRMLAMQALQGGEGKKTSKGDTESDTQKQVATETTAMLLKDPAEAAMKLPDDVRETLALCVTVQNSDKHEGLVRWDKFDADTLEHLVMLEPHEAQVAAVDRLLELKSTTRIDNYSSSLGGIIRTIRKYGYENMGTISQNRPPDGAKRKTKEEKTEEATRWKEELAEEGIVDGREEFNDGAIDDTAELNKLTGKPHQDDVIMYAVPVCAPYQTLSKYSFKVKLTPGNMKRGKAAKQCLEMMTKNSNSKAAPNGKEEKRLVDMVKKIGMNDWVATICPDVKISAPGASKATKHQKAKNKKSKGR